MYRKIVNLVFEIRALISVIEANSDIPIPKHWKEVDFEHAFEEYNSFLVMKYAAYL